MDLELHEALTAVSYDRDVDGMQRSPVEVWPRPEIEDAGIGRLDMAKERTQQHDVGGMARFEALPKEIIEQ